MSAFRAGDKIVEIAGVERRLRLSVSALAEMADAFDAESPKVLADCLRTATLRDWNIVLGCVARPPMPRHLVREEMLAVLPILSELIAEGLRA
jgi:hypothetical protein